MRTWSLILLAAISMALYQNCSGVHQSWNNQSSASSSGFINNPTSITAYEKNLYPIMIEPTRCVRCHAATQQPLLSHVNPAFAHDVLLSYSLVDLETPNKSRIVTKIRGGHNGFTASLATEIENAIQAWADEIVASGGTIGTSSGVLEARFSSIHSLILTPKCLSCHNSSGSAPEISYTDYASTVNTGGVEPFNGSGSELYKSCQTGSMPQNSPPLSTAETGAIKTWIDNGALNN